MFSTCERCYQSIHLGETVLITGSGSGLGRGMAIEFAKLGSKIVLWDINEKGNMETKKMLDDLKAVVSSVHHQSKN
ncbi:hypothetical protein ANCCEY_01577 [Ancylostoma ceylanicum]|uniref:Uncharacterized protein n=1 Tax=Ancylostoma ceylanicum TaxID=53326 RepID=A0A0D6M590_9BILA|nr:hypothetical protein ANCCEY_01577 [Ancylostoma ceylanicum]